MSSLVHIGHFRQNPVEEEPEEEAKPESVVPKKFKIRHVINLK